MKIKITTVNSVYTITERPADGLVMEKIEEKNFSPTVMLNTPFRVKKVVVARRMVALCLDGTILQTSDVSQIEITR